MSGIAVMRSVNQLAKGATLVSMGWGDAGERVTKVDAVSAPGFVYVTTSPGSRRYKVQAGTLVAVRQAPQ